MPLFLSDTAPFLFFYTFRVVDVRQVDDTGADLVRERHVVGDDQHPEFPFLGDFEEKAPDLGLGDDVEHGRDLVADEELRFRSEDAGDADPLSAGDLQRDVIQDDRQVFRVTEAHVVRPQGLLRFLIRHGHISPPLHGRSASGSVPRRPRHTWRTGAQTGSPTAGRRIIAFAAGGKPP